MSTGVPSPSRTPPGSPESTDARASANEIEQRTPSGSAARGRGFRPAARPARWTPSPAFTRVEPISVILVGVALALIASWPLVLHMSSRIAPDLGDPVRTAWEIAWVGH